MSDLTKQMFKNKSGMEDRIMEESRGEEGEEWGGDLPCPLPATYPVGRKIYESEEHDITLGSWSDCFDTEETLLLNGCEKLKVYQIKQTKELEEPLTFVCHHGAGHTSLSFGLMARALHQELEGACSILAYDARAHGQTQTENLELSLEQLTSDLEAVISHSVLAGNIILVGHSMGGAVVASAAAKPTFLQSSSTDKTCHCHLVGLVVIDVVEGTALAALSSMDRILAARPKTFETPEAAVRWSLQSRTLRNLESARYSLPSQLTLNSDKTWGWRTDLSATQPYWRGWFEGLSEKFLSSRAPKLLILAGTDRLDKSLCIGQMQGKFQLSVRPATSHVVQEDDPTGVSQLLAQFATRHHRPIPRP